MVTVGLTRRGSRRETVAAALEAVADQVDLEGVRRILVKPNFVATDRPLAATHVDAVRAVLDFLRARYDGSIVVAEGAALSPTWDGFRNYGYESLVKEYGVTLLDLNADDTVEVAVYDRRLRPMRLRLACTAVEADFRISICPPKTHDTVVVTLAIKNIVMGSLVNPHADRRAAAGPGRGTLARIGRMVPGRLRRSSLAERVKGTLLGGPSGSQKMAMHQGIPVINLNLALVALVVWPDLAVIDGWEGMEGEGPGHGDPVPWRIAIAGTDPLAVDALTAHLMGFEPEGIGYLHYCHRLGLGTADLEEIRTVGDLEPDAALRPFRPHPTVGEQRRWELPEAEELLGLG
jgi:uncharacterized protein (DUF362 family)